jgi:thiamine biosynthesis lipoprotein
MRQFGQYFSILVIFASVLISAEAWSAWSNGKQSIMGTQITVSLWLEDDKKAMAAVEGVMEVMRGVDQRLSPYIPTSELAQLNIKALQGPVKISDEMRLLYEESQLVFAMTDGAFDITFASVGKFYDYRQKKMPSDEQIQGLLPALNTELLAFDPAKQTLQFLNPNVAIDLGGIAKGYAVDLAISYLQSQGVEHAYISAGGDSRVIGDRLGRPWLIGIKNPRLLKGEEGPETLITLPLDNVAVSTSGDYERFFIDETTGERIHHIINPKTGRSASEVMSVTIIGEKGLRTDPLSTAVFVLGVQKGISLINGLPGYDAVIIDRAGQVHYSNGLMPPVSN